jgi:hypothetical protein
MTTGGRKRLLPAPESRSVREANSASNAKKGLPCAEGNRYFAAMRTILIIILILLLIGALPTWPYSTGWGYYPVGGVGLILLILIILALVGRI